MKVAVCDDEKFYVEQIFGFLEEINKKTQIDFEISTYINAEELDEEVEEGQVFDIVFIDIEIGKYNGIDIAEKIMKKNVLTIVVFMTAHEEHMIEAFRARPLGFLKKPLKTEMIEFYINKTKKMLNTYEYLEYERKGIKDKVPLDEICFLESDGRKIRIYGKKNDEFYGKMDDVFLKIDSKSLNFIRVHKSYVINSRYMISKNKNKIIMQLAGERVSIPISRSYEKKVTGWYIERLKSR